MARRLHVLIDALAVRKLGELTDTYEIAADAPSS